MTDGAGVGRCDDIGLWWEVGVEVIDGEVG